MNGYIAFNILLSIFGKQVYLPLPETLQIALQAAGDNRISDKFILSNI